MIQSLKEGKTTRVYNKIDENYPLNRQKIYEYIENKDVKKKYLKEIKFTSKNSGTKYMIDLFSVENKLKNFWNYTILEIYENKEDTLNKCFITKYITTIIRNYGSSPICFVDHPNGTDYLIVSEDYNGGYTIIDLNNYIEYIFFPNGWCIGKMDISEDKTKLIFNGSIWGEVISTKIFDFSEPPNNKDNFVTNFSNGLKIMIESEPGFIIDESYKDDNSICFWYKNICPLNKEDEEELKKIYEYYKDKIPNLEILYEVEEKKCDGGSECLVNDYTKVDKKYVPDKEWDKLHYYCDHLISLVYSVNIN